MKRIILSFIILAAAFTVSNAQERASEWTIDLARTFSSEIFESNGLPYMEPMVKAVNASSNARFFHTAFVPKEVDEPYFRFGLHGMAGLVPDGMRTYKPTIPAEPLDLDKLERYASVDIINQQIMIQDTAGLINYLFKTLLYNGLQDGSLKVPETAATILGTSGPPLIIPRDTLQRLAQDHIAFQFLPDHMKDSVLSVIGQIPTYFTLPPGGDFNAIFAFVPQLEIGALWGTEMLIRLIPPVDLGKEIGDFAFWGIGLKHSITQYFPEPYFDLAVQGVYQGTYLENKIGVTNSNLQANATILNFNLQASKSFENIIDVFTGLSLESLSINADFEYYLPVEVQAQLGLLRTGDVNGQPVIFPPEPEKGYPGDTEPQKSNVTLSDFNVKWILGVAKDIGPVTVVADYSVSDFNIFSGGIIYNF